jgi:GNAT superfamily N-acetyltransferase
MQVRPVRTRGELNAFVDAPYRLYARDPLWVPPFRRDVLAHLDRRKNPFFEHGEAEYFLAEQGGEVVGRVAAITNRLHNETHGDRVGFFGLFETVDDPAVAGALLDAAADWCRARGHDVMRGPVSFSVNDECGLLVDGFDTPPVVMMPHNPPGYAARLEQAGFTRARDLWVYERGDPERVTPLPERLERAAKILERRLRVRIRPLDLSRYDEEIERVKRLYNAAWEKNWGFVPMTERELDAMARQFKPVVIPDLVPFLEIDGEPVGFGIVLSDLNVVLRGNRAGRYFPASLRLLWAVKKRRIARGRVLLLGLLPKFRGLGLDAVLYRWLWTKMLEHGIRWGEAGWILEDNVPMNAALERMGFHRYKTYRLYDRAL